MLSVRRVDAQRWIVLDNGHDTPIEIVHDAEGYGFIETPRERWSKLNDVLVQVAKWQRQAHH